MNYRILTFALVIFVAGCEMATDPSLNASEGNQYAVSDGTTDAALHPEADASEDSYAKGGTSQRGMTLAEARAATAKYHRLDAALLTATSRRIPMSA